MPLLVNLRHLANENLSLEGELPVAELELETRDDLMQVGPPLEYEFEAQIMDQALLLQGRLSLTLGCECVRCLKKFRYQVEIPHWACHIPLEGEEKAQITGDCVDLTPYLREDILLEFPQHPLCDPECGGLPKARPGKTKPSTEGGPKDEPSAWTELDKLKL